MYIKNCLSNILFNDIKNKKSIHAHKKQQSNKNQYESQQVISKQNISNKLKKILETINDHMNKSNSQSIQQTLITTNSNKKYDYSLPQNQIFIESINQMSNFLLDISYRHSNQNIKKYQIKNIIGFYQIAKQLIHCQIDIQPSSLILFKKNDKQAKSQFNKQIIKVIFNQNIATYKDIYYRMEESTLFKNFIEEIFILFKLRTIQLFKFYGINQSEILINICISHIENFIVKYNMNQSQFIKANVTENQNNVSFNYFQYDKQAQFINTFSIDQIILCFVYLVFKLHQDTKTVRFTKIIQKYIQQILNEQNPNNPHQQFHKNKQFNIFSSNLIQFYNNFYLKFYANKKLINIPVNQIQINYEKSSNITGRLVQSGSTILDNYMSSLEG